MAQLVDLIVGALIAVSNRALLVFLVLAVIVAIAIVVMWWRDSRSPSWARCTGMTAPLSPDAAYAASARRDRSLDGEFFLAVVTTGIYCKPSCPARMPKRGNARFYLTAEAAEADGYRACKRCKPA